MRAKVALLRHVLLLLLIFIAACSDERSGSGMRWWQPLRVVSREGVHRVTAIIMSTVTRISGLQKCPTAVGHRHRVSVQFSRHFTRPGPDLHSNLYDIQRLLRPFTQISTRLIHYQKNSNCFVSQLPNLRIQQTRPMGAKVSSSFS